MKLIDTLEVIRQAGNSLNRKEPGKLYSILSVTSDTREGKGCWAQRGGRCLLWGFRAMLGCEDRGMRPLLVSCPDGAQGPKRAACWSPGTFRPLPPSMTSEGWAPRSVPTPEWEPHCGPASVRGLPGPAPASAVPPHPFLSLPAGQTPRPRGVSVSDHQALSAWPSAP